MLFVPPSMPFMVPEAEASHTRVLNLIAPSDWISESGCESTPEFTSTYSTQCTEVVFPKNEILIFEKHHDPGEMEKAEIFIDQDDINGQTEIFSRWNLQGFNLGTFGTSDTPSDTTCVSGMTTHGPAPTASGYFDTNAYVLDGPTNSVCNDTIIVTRDTGCNGCAGDYTIKIDTSMLADGIHSITMNTYIGGVVYSATYTIEVDTTPPVITGPSDQTCTAGTYRDLDCVFTTTDPAGYAYNFGVTATDNVAIDTTGTSNGGPGIFCVRGGMAIPTSPGWLFPVDGTDGNPYTMIICSVKDTAGNYAQVGFDVTVTHLPTVTASAYLNDTSTTGRTLKLAINDWTNDIGSFQTSIIMPDGSYFTPTTATNVPFHFWFGDTRSTITHFPIPEDWVAGNYDVEWKYHDNGWKYAPTSSVTVPALPALPADTFDSSDECVQSFNGNPWVNNCGNPITIGMGAPSLDENDEVSVGSSGGTGHVSLTVRTPDGVEIVLGDSYYPDGGCCTNWGLWWNEGNVYNGPFEILTNYQYDYLTISASDGVYTTEIIVDIHSTSADTTCGPTVSTCNFYFESLNITGDSDIHGPSIIVVVGESWHVTPTFAWEGTLPDSGWGFSSHPYIKGEIRYPDGTLLDSKTWHMISDGSVDYDAKTVTLDTWSEQFSPYLNWPVGGYLVTITADAQGNVWETNESDNVIERLDLWSSCTYFANVGDVCVSDISQPTVIASAYLNATSPTGRTFHMDAINVGPALEAYGNTVSWTPNTAYFTATISSDATNSVVWPTSQYAGDITFRKSIEYNFTWPPGIEDGWQTSIPTDWVAGTYTVAWTTNNIGIGNTSVTIPAIPDTAAADAAAADAAAQAAAEAAADAAAADAAAEIVIPSWIKNNAGWWADDLIDDRNFVTGLQWLITNGVMHIPPTEQGAGSDSVIPSWIKSNAEWWADDLIDDRNFVGGIQWLITNGVMVIG